jgi:outer membrane protein OmpA-like peptidoglycan-associated protein
MTRHRFWSAGALAVLYMGSGWAQESLKALATDWPDAKVSEVSTHGNSLTVEQGSRFILRIASTQDAHLAILLENPQGMVRVFVPKRADGEDRIIPGSEMIFPDLGSGETLYADLPTGKASLYLVATEQSAFANSAWIAGDPLPWVSAREVLERLSLPAVGHKAVTRLAVYVTNPTVKDFVSKNEFVEFYTNGTRSVENADRGFRIGFKVNSAELDDFSKRQLAAVGGGMRDQRLEGFRFSIEGHTDDTGSDEYNDDLSMRRAEVVRSYLEQASGVTKSRLDTRGYGKRKPQLEGTSEEARAQNRRVVIRRVDK